MINIHQPLQTRDGRKVEILKTNLKSKDGPILVLAMDSEGNEETYQVYENGSFHKENFQTGYDLIPAPPPALDLTKPVQTKSGRSVRILATDIKNENLYTVVAAVMREDGFEFIFSYCANGRFMHSVEDPMDLIPVPPQIQITFHPVFKDNYIGGSYKTIEEAADIGQDTERVGVIELKMEDGKVISNKFIPI